MQENKFSKEQIQVLFTANQYGIINLDAMSEDVNKMKESKILEEHKNFCEIWEATDGRWKTKLPDKTKKDGKRLIAKTSKAALEEMIIEWYKEKQHQEIAPNTLKSLFPIWIDFKAKETSDGNAYSLEQYWIRYYANDDIINKNVSDLKTIDVKEWFLDKIETLKLSNRQFKDMKSVLNMLLDYALEKELVQINVSRNVRGIPYKKFFEPKKKTTQEQIYIDDEEAQIIKIALAQYQKTHNTAYLAICLNFTLGLRVGELVALHTNDFTEDTLHISRQEIQHFVLINGKRRRRGYELVGHTKTLKSDRDLFLTTGAKKFLTMIFEANEQNGYTNSYLLLDKNGERLHAHSINNVLKRVNKILQTSQKGNHSIRKACISNMLDSKELTNEEIRDFAGHADFATTQKYYVFPTTSIDKRKNAYEKAICTKLEL